MDPIAYNALSEQILKPKKEKLIKALQCVVEGKELAYKPPMPNPQYFEIWFYHAFLFNYAVLGWQNIMIKLKSEGDDEIIDGIFQAFKVNFDKDEVAEAQFLRLQHDMEYDFFAECWAEIEKRIGRKIPCFLIEDSVHRGIYVNEKVKIKADEISGILKKAGVSNYHGD